MKDLPRLIVAAVFGGAIALSANSLAQKPAQTPAAPRLTPGEAVLRDISLQSTNMLFSEVDKIEQEQARAFELVSQKLDALDRENKDLKTLVILQSK